MQQGFDYIIIGSGLAGFQLALAFAEDSFFKQKSIAIIEPSDKSSNDKTWSFWEQTPSLFEPIVHKTWNTAEVYGLHKKLQLNLKPYTYKSIRSIDFYSFCKKKLYKNSQFTFIEDEVISVNPITLQLKTKQGNTFSAKHIFDSRIPTEFFSNKNKHITIQQHFKGFVVETENASFNATKFTMMDYRLKDGNQTTFMYVLPFSSKKALIEFTYFTPKLVDKNHYEAFLKKYISKYLGITNYTVIEQEYGVIPMSNYPFHKHNTLNYTKIGTAGGWVKASTGYSFKNTQKHCVKLIKHLKLKPNKPFNPTKAKYRFYDAVFLNVLKNENYKGEWLFTTFYKKNKPQLFFKFLDEESTFFEDVKIMCSLFSFSFIKAFFRFLTK